MGLESFSRLSVRVPPEECIESVPLKSAIRIDLNGELDDDDVALRHRDEISSWIRTTLLGNLPEQGVR